MDYRSLGSRKILVVEDVELNQYLARHIMESWGFEVEIAENGQEALKALDRKSFDLILMDIQMPVMDGIEATRQIRSNPDPSRSTIPIIALTANTFKEDIDRYFEIGMNDCLAKPFDEPRLYKIVSKCLMSTSAASEVQENVPVSNSHTPQNLYDLAMVEAISGGDKDFVRRMVILFLETMPTSLMDLEKACFSKDWEQTGKLAHKLKSTIDSMGIESLKSDIRQLESVRKDPAVQPNAEGLFTNIRDVLHLVMAQVKRDFQI